MRALINLYRSVLAAGGFGPAQAPGARHPEATDQFRHLIWMLEEMEREVGTGSWSKVLLNGAPAQLNRDIGFVQGALWSMSIFTLDELRKHLTEAPSQK